MRTCSIITTDDYLPSVQSGLDLSNVIATYGREWSGLAEFENYSELFQAIKKCHDIIKNNAAFSRPLKQTKRANNDQPASKETIVEEQEESEKQPGEDEVPAVKPSAGVRVPPRVEEPMDIPQIQEDLCKDGKG